MRLLFVIVISCHDKKINIFLNTQLFNKYKYMSKNVSKYWYMSKNVSQYRYMSKNVSTIVERKVTKNDREPIINKIELMIVAMIVGTESVTR